MINNPYTKLKQILRSIPAITDQLNYFVGTTIPLINGGVLAESEVNLPCITYYNNNYDSEFSNSSSIFTVNCYAKTESESFKLAKAIVDNLKGLQHSQGGYPVNCTARILATIPSPTDKEVNTAVEVRLFNIGGA